MFIIHPNWERVSGVLPDLDITINPVYSMSRLIISFWKNKGSILSKKKIFFGLLIQIFIKALAPRFEHPVPKITKFLELEAQILELKL